MLRRCLGWDSIRSTALVIFVILASLLDSVGFVAHHSGAAIEAELRGFAEALNGEFPRERSATADALWYADLTTGPDGELLTVDERLAEIAERYGPGDVVTRFVDRARPELVAAVRRAEARLKVVAAQSR